MRPVDFHQRSAVLKAKRELKMARSAHAYVRGSTERFYLWLQQKAAAALPVGPNIWICGDCHVGNLGPVGRDLGTPVVEFRDLDQAVIGNPAHDLVRLALSLAMAARGSDLPGVTTAQMTENLVAGYEAAFIGDEPSEEIDELPGPIKVVMKRAVRRTSKQLLDESLGDARRALPLGRRFWPLSRAEREEVEALVKTPELRRLVTLLESRDDDAEVRFVDAAYWVKGCSSLGLWRGAVLVEILDGDERATYSLLDIKQAAESWAPEAARAQMPKHGGERVVMAAQHLAPALGARMSASVLLGRDVFVRELLPQDLKVELDSLTAAEGRAVAHYLGMVVGRAHGRQMDGAARNSWREEMASHRTKNIDAPNWLWTSVVDLVAEHERAYLEHCRLYALTMARLEG
jgi:uncharacterized protein (DUF2252 family)